MPFCSLSMTLFSRSCLLQCKLGSAPHVQESQDNTDAVSVYVLKTWSYIKNLCYLQEYCEWILYKWTINVLVEMPTLLIGHLGWNWTREWEKLKQKSACSKKLNSSSERPKREPALSQTLPKQDLQSKWTKSTGAGTFPELPEKADLLAVQDAMEIVGAHYNSGVGNMRNLHVETPDLISLRILIFKTRSNPAIRKHNTVLRCHLFRCVYDFKKWH